MQSLKEAIKHCYDIAKNQCGNLCGKDHIQLAKWLEELQEYRKIGTVEEVREAVDKQENKKVIRKPWQPCECPTCNKELSESVGDGYYKHYYYLKRCPECGQKIDWSMEE